MKKRIFVAAVTFLLSLLLILPVTTSAQSPEIMRALKSYIQTYGALKSSYRKGSEVYTSKISYQKSKKRFLFECSYSNGGSTSSVKMYMPASKKKENYKVLFHETVRAAGRTAKISGKTVLNRKTYSNQTSYLKFSRKNRTSSSKKITNSLYQSAANSLLRVAFGLWENSLETKVTICFVNFGFYKVTVLNSSRVYAYEW